MPKIPNQPANHLLEPLWFLPILNWQARSWTTYSSEASPAQAEEATNLVFFFPFLCTDLIFSELQYQFCRIYTERAPLAFVEPGVSCCPFGRTSISALLSQPVFVLPWVQYSRFLLAALQEAFSTLSWSLSDPGVRLCHPSRTTGLVVCSITTHCVCMKSFKQKGQYYTLYLKVVCFCRVANYTGKVNFQTVG